MEKRLHQLTLFTPREEDWQHVEGGGSSEPPKWLLHGARLRDKAQRLKKSFTQAIDEKFFDQCNGVQVPQLLLVVLDGSATAKTRRTYVVDLLEIDGNNPVIGLRGDSSLLVTVDSLSQAEAMETRLDEYETYAHAVSCIESFTQFKAELEVSHSERSHKLKLLDFGDSEINQLNADRMLLVLKSLGCEFSRATYLRNGPAVFKLKKFTEAQLSFLIDTPEFRTVDELVVMPAFIVEEDSLPGTRRDFFVQRNPDMQYATLGILDSGIEPLDVFKPWMPREQFTQYPSTYLDTSHGTAVASVALLGDLLEGAEWVGRDGIELMDCAVVPNQSRASIDEDELIMNVKEAVNSFPDVRIWNMSISLTKSMRENTYSDFASVLDELQVEKDMLICKSTGNHFMLTKEHYVPITAGSESVMCISVGSMAHAQHEGDFSPIDGPSPFTRRGPGPNSLIKPDVSHYGGNGRIDEKSHQMIPTGVSVLSQSGTVTSTVGSSFSTPRVSGLACRLAQSLNYPFDPLLIKALIIHSAKYPEALALSEQDRVDLCGYGIPSSLDHILYDSPDEITLILRSKLPKGRKVEILDFPMPNCLVRDEHYAGQITATLVHKPLLDPSQGLEFCQSEVSLQFGTYDCKELRDMTKRNVLNPVGRSGSKNVFSSDLLTQRAIKNSEHLANERALVYQGKYHPVKKYVADLDYFTETRKNQFLGHDRSWYLQLKGLYRDQITRRYKEQRQDLPDLDVCLVMTLRDSSQRGVLNTNVIQMLDTHNFWHDSLKLNSEVQVSVER